jgi:hypothetical protein
MTTTPETPRAASAHEAAFRLLELLIKIEGKDFTAPLPSEEAKTHKNWLLTTYEQCLQSASRYGTTHRK